MKTSIAIAGFEVLTSAFMMSSIFGDIMLCSSLNVIRHYHSFFGPEDGGDMSL
jgi:hypothetical protein